MGCGCSKRAGVDQADKSGGYGGGLACAMCYAKHLGKASVEASEFMEDRSRFAELSRAVGDIGCAEDHAAALGLDSERERLRSVRSRLWTADRLAVAELQSLAEAAAKLAVESAAETADRRRERIREALSEARSGGASSGGSSDVQ